MPVAGWLPSALALNGVTWTASSQSKSKVSLKPSEVLSLFPWDVGAALARVADRSRLLERALGLGFSHGFFNGARSCFRPLSVFCFPAPSGLLRGRCWVCFLLGRCWLLFLGWTVSGVECWNSSASSWSTKSSSSPCFGRFGLLLQPLIGLAIKASKPAMESPSLNDLFSCTHSDLLLPLLSGRPRLTPTVDGKLALSFNSGCAFFSDKWGSMKKRKEYDNAQNLIWIL